MRDVYSTVNDDLRSGYIIRTILIIGFLLICLVLLILRSLRQGGYVVDIYSTLPITYYIFLALVFLFGSATILFARGVTRKLGILLLIFTHAAILAIPFMLGYYSMGRADDMTYIGEYLQISQSGQISYFDIYPASHILGATISLVTGLAANSVAFIIPVVFSFLFIGGLVLFSRFLLKDQNPVDVALPASFILYLGPYNFLNVPHALFFALMPLVLLLIMRYIETKRPSQLALSIPFLFLLPFMHPFIVFFLISFLVFLFLGGRYLKRFLDVNYRHAFMPFMIVLTGFLAWFSYSNKLKASLSGVHNSYINEATTPVILETTEKLSRINVDVEKIVRLLLVFYGRYTLPLVIISFSLILIYIKRVSISHFLRDRIQFLIIMFMILFGIQIVLFFNPIISHQPDRLANLNFIVYAQVPLFAASLSLLLRGRKRFNRNTAFLLLILTGTWGVSLSGTFDSPNIYRPSIALTHNEVEGMQWYYETKDNENVIVPFSQIGRFRDLFGENRMNPKAGSYLSVPDHFGYSDSNQHFTESVIIPGGHGNVILLTYDELLYQEVPGYKDVGRYNAGDYVRFRNDHSVSGKVFDGTDIEIYYV